MGNQQSQQNRNSFRRSRYRTVEHTDINKSKINASKRFNESFRQGSIFVTPPINRSVQVYHNNQNNDQDQGDEYDVGNKNYQSIDAQDRRRVQSNKRVQRSENDRVLQSLSRKNEQLRKQLKKISQDLSQKLKRKKLVPKKKGAGQDDNQSEAGIKVVDKEQIGLKKQLQNGYKQIEMYKKLIIELKGKQEGVTADHRVNVLENEIASKNEQIQKYQQKKVAYQKVRNKQNQHIKLQINQDLQSGVDTYKRQVQQLHNKLKKYAAADRAKEQEYKVQQAYLCDLQRKWREINQQYFPDMSNKLKKDQPKTAASDKDVNPHQFNQIAEEARRLKIKHEEYNRKIELFLLAKNKRIEQQNDLKDQVVYKQRIIEALKIKVATLQKLLKPRKNNLFGYDSQQGSEAAHSDFNDNQSEIQRQLQEQLNQDQFDIKHLIANIPKPVRKRPQELSNGYSSGGSSGGDRKKGYGMIVTSQKAQPKKWGASTTRTQQRGKHFKGQLAFEDRAQFDGDVQPIIVGVNVWVNKNNTILGVQAIYLNNNELRYGVKSSDSAEGIIKRFDLQTPDYLKNLTFTISRDGYIQSMTLYSKQGKVGKFGNKRSQDENMNFGLASNERPFMFFGASSLFETQPRLNCFGLQICSQ